jgi:protein-disulfide isomerase
MRIIPAGIVLLIFISASNPSILGQNKKTQEQVLATVNGTVITEAQVRQDGAEEMEAFELEKLKTEAVSVRTKQAIIEKHLDLLIDEKVLDAEAAKRGITKQELLSTEVQSKMKEPTAEEIDSFYEMNADRINMAKEMAAPKIKNYLQRRGAASLRRELLDRLKKEQQIVRSIKPLRFNISTAGRPASGPANAPVTMVVFSDFECPYCREFSSTIREIKKQYGDKVRLVFRQFPLKAIHPDAQKAAEAALCADRQKKFWEMHDLLFKDQSSLSVDNLKSKAKELGLDTAAFNACLEEGATAALIHEDLVAAFSAGVDGTPSTFVNGRFINGNAPIEEIAAAIDEELGMQKAPAKSTPAGSAKK